MNSVLKISIPSFAEQYVNNTSETFYKINVHNKYTNEKWALSKTFKNFEDLELQLYSNYAYVPELGGKSMFKVSSFEILKQRQEALTEFLNKCIKRKDIFSSDAFAEFLMLPEHAPELISAKAVRLNLSEKFPFAIKQFFYVESEGIIFIIASELGLTKQMENYFTNVTLPWEESQTEQAENGAFMVYKVIENEKKGFLFEKVFIKTFTNVPSILTFDEVSRIVAIGFNNGEALLFKNYDQNSLATEYDLFCEMKHHSKEVTGIGLDFKSGYIYTCSCDKDFIGCPLNKVDDFEVINTSEYVYTHMIYDCHGCRAFLAYKLTGIEIYTTQTYPPILVADVQSSCEDVLMDMLIDYPHGYIFACSMNRYIYVFKLGDNGKEKNTKEISSFPATCNCESIAYDGNLNELLIGDIEGRITVLNLKTAQPIKVFDAHQGGISCFYLNKSKRMMIIGSEDNTISVWQLPKKWVNEDINQFEINEAIIESDTQAMLRLQKSNERGDDYNSDEDSVSGWDFLPEDEL